jgi:hypothetical protein
MQAKSVIHTPTGIYYELPRTAYLLYYIFYENNKTYRVKIFMKVMQIFNLELPLNT